MEEEKEYYWFISYFATNLDSGNNLGFGNCVAKSIRPYPNIKQLEELLSEKHKNKIIIISFQLVDKEMYNLILFDKSKHNLILYRDA